VWDVRQQANTGKDGKASKPPLAVQPSTEGKIPRKWLDKHTKRTKKKSNKGKIRKKKNPGKLLPKRHSIKEKKTIGGGEKKRRRKKKTKGVRKILLQKHVPLAIRTREKKRNSQTPEWIALKEGGERG